MTTVLRLTMNELQVQCHLRPHRPLPLQQMPVHMVAVARPTAGKTKVEVLLLYLSSQVRPEYKYITHTHAQHM